jgi:hypothetical protein
MVHKAMTQNFILKSDVDEALRSPVDRAAWAISAAFREEGYDPERDEPSVFAEFVKAAERVLHALEWDDVTLMLHNARAYMLRERDDDGEDETVEKAARDFMIERITSLLRDGNDT